jgi:hypothetical protein
VIQQEAHEPAGVPSKAMATTAAMIVSGAATPAVATGKTKTK